MTWNNQSKFWVTHNRHHQIRRQLSLFLCNKYIIQSWAVFQFIRMLSISTYKKKKKTSITRWKFSKSEVRVCPNHCIQTCPKIWVAHIAYASLIFKEIDAKTFPPSKSTWLGDASLPTTRSAYLYEETVDILLSACPWMRYATVHSYWL